MGEAATEIEGVRVDQTFVRAHGASIKVAEIRAVIHQQIRTDAHVQPVIWAFGGVVFFIWIVAPIANAAAGIFLLGLIAYGFYRKTNRAPTRHEIWINTGGSFNKRLLVTTDEGSAVALHAALEHAMDAGTHVRFPLRTQPKEPEASSLPLSIANDHPDASAIPAATSVPDAALGGPPQVAEAELAEATQRPGMTRGDRAGVAGLAVVGVVGMTLLIAAAITGEKSRRSPVQPAALSGANLPEANSGAPAEFPPPNTVEATPVVKINGDDPAFVVRKAESGSLWPYPSADVGIVRCKRGTHQITIEMNGVEYGLNGKAQGAGFTPSQAAMGDPAAADDTGQWIQRGLALCEY